MEYITDVARIKELMDQKKMAEIEMAKELKESIFKLGPVRGVIQKIAYQAIHDLLTSADQDEVRRYITASAKPGAYRFFTLERCAARYQRELFSVDGNRSLEQLQQISDKTTGGGGRKPPHEYFDPEDCSDAMRLYAEFIEECGPGGRYQRSGRIFDKTTQETFGNRIWSYKEWIQARRKIRGEQKILKRKKWGWVPGTKKDRMIVSRKQVARQWKGAPKKDPFEAKKFKKKDDEEYEAFIARAMDDGLQLGDKKVRVRRQAKPQEVQEMLRSLGEKYRVVEPPEGGPKAGTAFWKLMPQSSVRQLDRMFGLTEIGADISGTTADTVGVLEVLYYDILEVETAIPGEEHYEAGVEIYLHIRPIVALLPLATMVSLGHHTTLECAYVLSRNDYIDYSVGYYTSLFPPEWCEVLGQGRDGVRYDLKVEDMTWLRKYNIPRAVREIARDLFLILWGWEIHDYNHKLMLYYDENDQLKGAFKIDDKKEGFRFRNLATISKNLNTYIYSFYKDKQSRYPSRDVVFRTASKHRLLRELYDAMQRQRRR